LKDHHSPGNLGVIRLLNKKQDKVTTAQEIIDDYLQRSGVKFEADSMKLPEDAVAGYAKKLDVIRIRPIERFESLDHYYTTLFHELAHSTGHPMRLDRPGIGVPISIEYVHEELIAELASAFLDDEAGIHSTSTIHSNYMKGYIEAVDAGPEVIAWAAGHAAIAADMVLGRKSEAARKLLAA